MKTPNLVNLRAIAEQMPDNCPWEADYGSVIDSEGRVLFHAMDWGSEKFVAAADRDTVLYMLDMIDSTRADADLGWKTVNALGQEARDRIVALQTGLKLALQIVESVEQCRGVDAIYNAKDIETSKSKLQKLAEDVPTEFQPI